MASDICYVCGTRNMRGSVCLTCCPDGDPRLKPANTRPMPAATDTGLVRYDLSMFGNGIVEMGGGAYVLADQAEELLAAKDAENAYLKELVAARGETIKRGDDRIRKLEADNAALTARVKELEKINANLMGDDEDKPRYTTKRLKQEIAKAMEALDAKIDDAEINEALKGLLNPVRQTRHPVAHRVIRRLYAQNQVLETQLAAARKALEFYADVHKYPAPFTGGMGDLWSDCGAIARAALEAKP